MLVLVMISQRMNNVCMFIEFQVVDRRKSWEICPRFLFGIFNLLLNCLDICLLNRNERKQFHF